MTKREIISDYMRKLGQKTSPAKRAASIANAELGWRARWKDHVKKVKPPKKRPKTLAKTTN